MGLGKTFVGSEKMKELGEDLNIIVCQKSKIDDWYEHIKTFYPNYNVIKYDKPQEIKPNTVIIINYDICDCKLVDDIEEKLRKIDIIIGVLDTYIKEISGALIISSLYGIEKELYNKKQELCKINFSVRVPIIVDDISYSKNNYSLSEGSIYDLSNTVFKNINNKYNGNSLIKRKSSLFSIFYKKGGK